MILGETCKLLQLSGEFPCHVNLQPAPYQSSVAQGTNCALSIPVGWIIKEVSKNGNKKAKVQLGIIYKQRIYSQWHAILFLFPLSSLSCAHPLLPPATTKKAKQKEREREREL